MSELYPISGCEDERRAGDVVFVHGLGDDARHCWQHAALEAGDAWPRWLGQEFPNVGVWTLDYPVAKFKWQRWFQRGDANAGHAMPLPDRARDLLDLLLQRGVGKRPLLLIAHSLGGLMVKQILRRAADSGSSTPERGFTGRRARCCFWRHHMPGRRWHRW